MSGQHNMWKRTHATRLQHARDRAAVLRPQRRIDGHKRCAVPDAGEALHFSSIAAAGLWLINHQRTGQE